MNGSSNENKQAVCHGASSLTGIAAYIVQFAIFLLLAAPIVYARPRWDILLTGGLWFAFSIYWGLA